MKGDEEVLIKNDDGTFFECYKISIRSLNFFRIIFSPIGIQSVVKDGYVVTLNMRSKFTYFMKMYTSTNINVALGDLL